MRHLLAGLAACALLSPLLLRLAGPRLSLTNYRKKPVKVVGGLAIGGAVAVSEVLSLVLGERFGRARLATLAVVFGFLALGLLDDLSGDGSSRGLGGHLKALLEGRVTTGLVKAAGGLALGGLVGLWLERSIGRAAVDGLLIALSANFVNLLDLRPGRACKLYLLVGMPLVVFFIGAAFAGPLIAATGAVIMWLFADLGERGMLGDAGANMLGAVLGMYAVFLIDLRVRILVIVVLALLTLASERWSFSQAIDRVQALRWLDRLGRS